MSRSREAQVRAAHWIIAREEPDWNEFDQRELDAWLAQSDMNRIAFLRLEYSWREADRIGVMRPTMVPQALPSDRTERWGYRGLNRWEPFTIAASLILMIGIGLYAYGPDSRPSKIISERFDTNVGDRKVVSLSDGSKVELNTASTVRMALEVDRREIWLDRGEAYFEVAHDKSRPFVVHAGTRQVTVLGTKFSVRRDGDKVSIFVREGRVRVDDLEQERPIRSTTIAGGDIALARGNATLVTAASNERVQDALAWREGMLVFEKARLSEVAAEFNRYNRQQLIITDAEVAGIRIGGMFPSSKPGEFVRLLHDAYGLKIRKTPQEFQISN